MKIKILVLCSLLVGVGFTAVHILKVPVGNLLYFGAIFLCPLMHIFMMKNMHADHAKDRDVKNRIKNA